MSPAIFALFAAAFAIGTSEFVIAGILPALSSDLSISIPTAGLLVSLYALGVAVGGPLLAAFTGKAPRKRLLLIYVGVFAVGYVACALAPTFETLLLARLFVSLIHGAYFGTAMIVATSVVADNRRSLAVALVLSGLTVANVVGVPLGAFIGNGFGWRFTFWAVAALGVASFAAVALIVPRDSAGAGSSGSFLAEIRVLGREPVWSSLAVIALQTIGQFAVFTYIAPLLTDVAGLPLAIVPILLVLFGVGSTLGVLIGGRLADWNLMGTLIGVLALQVVTYGLMAVFVGSGWAMAALVLIWGALAFAFGSPVQARILKNTTDAPLLAASLIPSAFNISIAGGAALGGGLIQGGYGYASLPWVGFVTAAAALAVAVWSRAQSGPRR